MCVSTQQLWWYGGMPPRKCFEPRDYEIASETTAPYSTGFSYDFGFLLTLQATQAFAEWGLWDYLFTWRTGRKTQRLEKLRRNSFSLFAAILQVSTCGMSPANHTVCMLALCGHPIHKGANWRCQTNHEWGKKWSGWNRNNWTGTYTLHTLNGFWQS